MAAIEQTPLDQMAAELREADERPGSESGAAQGHADGTAAVCVERDLGGAIVDAIGALVVVLDREGRIVRINRAFEALTGRARDDVAGALFWGIFLIPEEVEAVRAVFDSLCRGHYPSEFENHIVTRDGSHRLIAWHNTAVPGPDGAVQYVIGTGVDVTERRRAEAALRESEERYRRLVELSPDMIAVHDGKTVLFVNPAGVQLLGATAAEELVGTPALDVVHPDYRDAAKARMAKAIKERKPAPRMEEKFLRRDGSAVDVEVASTPITYQGRSAVLVHVRDITARKAADDALRSAVQELRIYARVVDESPDFISVVDRQYTYRMVNPTYCRLNAVPANRLIGHTPAYTLGEEVFQGVIRPNLDRCFAGETVRYEAWFDYRAVGRRYIEVRYYPLYVDNQVQYAVVVGHDITERQEAEDTLQRQQRLLDAIFDNILADVAYLDHDFNFVRVNATYARESGHTAEELIGRNHFELFPNEENQRIFARVRDTGEAYVARARAFEFADQPERGMTYWDWWLRPIPGPTGEVEGLVLSLVDVTATERTRLEVEHLNADLREASATKDRFLAVLSHELRNPLAPILAGVYALRQRMPDDERIRHTLEIIERNVKLQARLVDDLLDLSRITRGKMQFRRAPVALDVVVNAAVEDQRDEIEKGGSTLTLATAPGLWVLGDFGRLQQAVLNLLTNAIKFTPRGGEIRVRVWECERAGTADAPDAVPDTPARPDPHPPTHARACIAVEDTGIGIDRALMDHLFEMFRQGEVGERRRPGLGIGLALVRSIVEGHGGRVWAESEGPGKGSRFTIELPLIAPPERPTVVEQEAEPAQESILLVEDNPDTRTLLAESLGLMGYSVQAAASAEEALELLQGSKPDVILADIGLPGMDGYEFLRRARRMPELAAVPAFALTGFGQEEDVRRAHEAGYTDHLVKPVDVAALDRQMRRWLQVR